MVCGSSALQPGDLMTDKTNFIYAFVAGPIVIGAAYGVSSLLLGETSLAETGGTDMAMAYGLLLWVGTPIVLVALLPMLGGLLKFLKRR